MPADGIRRYHQQPSSKTALFLASKWAWGEYSPQEVQRIAALAKADILTAIESSSGFSDLDALAQLGSNGRLPQHCHSELVRLLQNNTSLVPAKVDTPINNLTGKEVCKADVPLFEPHATMATLYEQHQDAFKERILPDVDELEKMECYEGQSAIEGSPGPIQEGLEEAGHTSGVARRRSAAHRHRQDLEQFRG